MKVRNINFKAVLNYVRNSSIIDLIEQSSWEFYCQMIKNNNGK